MGFFQGRFMFQNITMPFSKMHLGPSLGPFTNSIQCIDAPGSVVFWADLTSPTTISSATNPQLLV